jgi:hypothetical protein
MAAAGVSLTAEDMNISDQDDEDAGRVFSSRNLEVILAGDGKARIIEDAPDGDGVADACEGGSYLELRCSCLMPHGGRQLSWLYQ